MKRNMVLLAIDYNKLTLDEFIEMIDGIELELECMS